uniref:RICIN domain-containing protein n=1 Tax=Streptomyces sp. NBC_00998 TaxID=2903712 RepID=UPI002F91B3F6|nr:RICIN domain-containing protein [Streptomyces sp. NBC_00998]
MVKAGRPQGDSKGATEAANALARFLRELTDGMSLRDLAESYEGGKTLWGEYRSGAQVIPLPRLNSVVKDRVRDARGRAAMLAKARHLHELAMTAKAESRPATGWGEALQRAQQDIADMGRLIKVLLARIDVLQDEAAKQSADPGPTDFPGGPVETIAAQLDVLRQHVAEARRVRDATLKAYGAAQSEAADETADEDAAAAAGSGSELVGSLAELHDTVARQQDALRLWTAGSPAPDAEATDADATSVSGDSAEEDDGGSAAVRGDDSRDGGEDQDGDEDRDGGAGAGEEILAPGASRNAVEGKHAGDRKATAGEGGIADTPSADSPAVSSADSSDARDSPDAKTGPPDSGEEPAANGGGRRLLTGAGVAVLIAACVLGGVLIGGNQKGSAEDRNPEARLNTPTAPVTGPTTPSTGIPDLQIPAPSTEPTPTPSASDLSEEDTQPVAKPKSEGPSVVASRSQVPQPVPPASAVVGSGPRAWVNAGTQMCLEIRRSSGDDGATANQWSCNNSSSQKWSTTNPAGWTTLVHMDSGKCLEIRRDSVDDGAAANQWTCNGSATQSWRWQGQPGGGWSLVNANSGKCLTIRGQGDGVLATQQPCDGTPTQTWN